MSLSKIERVFVVGSGFSAHAGLPLVSEFTQAILAARAAESGKSRLLVNFLNEFVQTTFPHEEPLAAEDWPSLEDLFTSVDLAANTGHCLGKSYDAARLRTVRRALISRIIRMLGSRYKAAWIRKDASWRLLKKFLTAVPWDRSAFVVMNWDAVIENRLFAMHENPGIDYGCDAAQASFPSRARGRRLTIYKRPRSPSATVIKMHGSVNWLYCDNCRQLFWFPPLSYKKIADQLLTPRDWSAISPGSGVRTVARICPRCRSESLSTRLATFSYRKALEFPMFQKSWSTAEAALSQAQRWGFIGYSMPAADYEFKFLLKRLQSARTVAPEFVLVTGGSAAQSTYENYRRFFGRGVQTGKNCFLDGLTEQSISELLS
jgi:hypothetical protein